MRQNGLLYCPIPDEMARKITFLFTPLQLQLRQARFDFRVEWIVDGKKKKITKAMIIIIHLSQTKATNTQTN